MPLLPDAATAASFDDVDYLLGGKIVDGKPSGPPVLFPKPFLNHGTVLLHRASGVKQGPLADATERTVRGNALQAAFDAAASGNRFVEDWGGRYEYICTTQQDIRSKAQVDANAAPIMRNFGLLLRTGLRGFATAGSTPFGTVLVNYADNHPVATYGDMTCDASQMLEGVELGGCLLGHGASQTGKTQADGLVLGRIWRSKLGDFSISPHLGDGVNHANVSLRVGLSADTFFFQNKVGNIVLKSAQETFLRSEANGTGNAWSLIYCGGIGEPSGTGTFGNRRTLSGPPVLIRSLEFGSAEQLNIEWVKSSTPFAGIVLQDCDGMHVEYMHIEGVQMNGFDSRLIHAAASRVHIDQLKGLDVWIAAANMTGIPALLRAYGDSRVKVEQMKMAWNGVAYSGEAVASTGFRLVREDVDTNTVGRKAFIDVEHFDLQGHTGAFAADDTMTAIAPTAAGGILSMRSYSFDRTRSKTDGATINMTAASMTQYGVHRNAKVWARSAINTDATLTLSPYLAASGAGSTTLRQGGDIVGLHRTGGGSANLLVAGGNADGSTTALSANVPNATMAFFEWTGSVWVAR